MLPLQTLLKWRVKEASLYQMSLFVSSIGALNLLVLWPVVLILHATGQYCCSLLVYTTVAFMYIALFSVCVLHVL